MTDLEQEILEIINETVDGKYIGKLKVAHDGNYYELKLYFNRYMTPTVLGIEGDEDRFKDFVRSEMHKRQLQKVKFYEVREDTPVLECKDGRLRLNRDIYGE